MKLKLLSIFWRKKEFSFQQRLMNLLTPFSQTLKNANITKKTISFVGVEGNCFVKGFYDINCDAASTGESRQRFKAESYRRHVIIPTIASSIINFNSYARCYV